MSFEYKAFNKGFSVIKSLVDDSKVKYDNAQVLDPSWTNVGGMYLEIEEVPVTIELSDNEKKYIITIESIEGNIVVGEADDKEILINALKNIEKNNKK